MSDSKDFLDACQKLATDKYENHKGDIRRRASLSELLVVSKFYNELPKKKRSKIQNIENGELDYFSNRSEMTRSLMSHTIGYESLFFFCTKFWDVRGFNYFLNDISDRYKVLSIDLLFYHDFSQACSLKISQNDFFIKIDNISEVESGDYYFIFELEDIWTCDRSKFAYFMDFH